MKDMFGSTVRMTVGVALMVAALASASHAGGPIISAPEIDPGSIGAAMTLLAAGAFVLSGKSRKA
jgi:hypothetical protein